LPSSLQVIAEYLQHSVSAERSFETQFRSCSKDGDDSEVQNYFETSARRAAEHIQILETRLTSLNATEQRSTNFFAELLAMAPKAAQLGHTAEERIAQNLIKGFSITKSACAMYLALKSAAGAAGDEQTAELAGRLAAEGETAAEGFWHFIPSRSKIAYNVSTAGEIDPSVETRAPDDRLTETLS
jgi:ferritin-like metal-binding protein YciE